MAWRLIEVAVPEEQVLTGQALRGLAQIPGLTNYGVRNPDSGRFTKKGGVILFRMQDVMANQVAKELAEQGGIGVRYGCHYAHLMIKHLLQIHPLLAQFQGVIVSLFPQVSLPGVTRVSLGIDALMQMVSKIAQQPRSDASNPFAATKTDITPVFDFADHSSGFAGTGRQRPAV